MRVENDDFAFDELPDYEQRLLISVISDILTQEQILALTNSGDKSLDFFVANKWEFSLSQINGIGTAQFKKIKKLQKSLIPDGAYSYEEQLTNRGNSIETDKRGNGKRAKIDSVSSELHDATIQSEKSKVSANHSISKEAIELPETIKQAFRDAFAEFAKTYRKEVKRQPYHLVNPDTMELTRVIYLIPPKEYIDPPQYEQFVWLFHLIILATMLLHQDPLIKVIHF